MIFIEKRKWWPIYIDNIPTNYLVSNDAIVYNVKTKTILTGSHDARGYIIVSIWFDKKLYSKKVHRLVAEAFIPNPENKPTVNHKDGNKENNYDWNLEWATHKENIDHAIETGLRNINGINSSSNIYTEEQVHEVCKLLEMNKSPKEISILLNVSPNLPSRIKYLGKWKDIAKNYNIPQAKKVPWKNKNIIIELFNQGYSNIDIINELKLEDNKSVRSNLNHIKWKYNKSKISTTIEN